MSRLCATDALPLSYEGGTTVQATGAAEVRVLVIDRAVELAP